MQNLNIQYQNLRLLSSLNYGCSLTLTQQIIVIIIIIGMCGLIAYGIKKFIENI